MEYGKSNYKRNLVRTALPQEMRKILNEQLNYIPKEPEKKKKQSLKFIEVKEIIKIKSTNK